MTSRLRSGGLVLALGLGGCGLADALLEHDLRALLTRHGVATARLECRQSGRTRDGTCLIGLSSAQAAGAVAGLGLTPATGPDGQRLLRLLARSSPAGCQSVADRSASGWRVYYAAGRPAALRTGSGSAFEYLVFYYDERSGSGCIDLAYAYG